MLPFTGEIALLCVGMHVPDPQSFRDLMIAATAQQHSLTLATRNVADFAGPSIKMLNPWEHQK